MLEYLFHAGKFENFRENGLFISYQQPFIVKIHSKIFDFGKRTDLKRKFRWSTKIYYEIQLYVMKCVYNEEFFIGLFILVITETSFITVYRLHLIIHQCVYLIFSWLSWVSSGWKYVLFCAFYAITKIGEVC